MSMHALSLLPWPGDDVHSVYCSINYYCLCSSRLVGIDGVVSLWLLLL